MKFIEGPPGSGFFALGLLLIALIAVLSSPSRIAKVTIDTGHVKEGIYDTTGLGHSILAQVLEENGHRVYDSLGAIRPGGKSLAIIVADPQVCEGARKLANYVRAAGTVFVLIATNGQCLDDVLAAIGAPPVRMVDTGSDIGVAKIGDSNILLYRPSIAIRFNGWTPLGYLQEVWPPRGIKSPSPTILVYTNNGKRVALVTSSHAFSNKIMYVAAERGYANPKVIVDLINTYAGRDAPVAFAAEFHEPVRSVTSLIRINPAQILVGLLTALRDVERGIIATLRANPIMLLAYTLLATLIFYTGAKKSVGGRTISEKEPSYEGGIRLLGISPQLQRVLGGAKLDENEARAAIVRLYNLLDIVLTKKLGVSVDKVLENPERLNSVRGIDATEVVKGIRELSLLKKKISGERRLTPLTLPFILTWQRRFDRVLSRIEPLFEALGASLKETRRGVERVLAG